MERDYCAYCHELKGTGVIRVKDLFHRRSCEHRRGMLARCSTGASVTFGSGSNLP